MTDVSLRQFYAAHIASGLMSDYTRTMDARVEANERNRRNAMAEMTPEERAKVVRATAHTVLAEVVFAMADALVAFEYRDRD